MITRQHAFDSLQEPFDVLVLGGGATGLGIAVDAVTRGFRTALVEAGDFAQATSSRATKLVHGGVRYLASGQIHLVYEALHERAVMMRNAPNLVRPQAFLLPAYTRWELPYYGAGLLAYDLMSGRSSMGPTRVLGRKASLDRIPNLAGERLSGSVLYHDGQFNDARLALALARTAQDRGATVLNYARCTRLLHANNKVGGAIIADVETGAEHTVHARVVFNATGIFTDALRRLDDPEVPPLLTVSRGTHIVVAAEVLGGNAGIMVPKTRDGRVIFAIPWQGRVVIGTTDLPAPTAEMEPGHTHDEIGFLLETVNPFLARQISESDILSVFSGLRPLVTGKAATTSKISREHHIDASPTGLITVAGGKWTTYRRMAEDAIRFAVAQWHARTSALCDRDDLLAWRRSRSRYRRSLPTRVRVGCGRDRRTDCRRSAAGGNHRRATSLHLRSGPLCCALRDGQNAGGRAFAAHARPPAGCERGAPSGGARRRVAAQRIRA